MRELHKQEFTPAHNFEVGGSGSAITVVVLVVVLACTIEDQMAESCGLEGYRDGAITSQPHHLFMSNNVKPLKHKRFVLFNKRELIR